MGITEKILLVLFAVFALLAVLRLFAAPLKLAGKLLVNTLLGFALLGILSALGVLAKLSLGLNLFNALVIAVLGVPGLALLILRTGPAWHRGKWPHGHGSDTPALSCNTGETPAPSRCRGRGPRA